MKTPVIKKPKVIYEHTTDEEISGVIIDGMSEMMGSDITGSEYEVGQEWPGVPSVPLPPIFYANKKHLEEQERKFLDEQRIKLLTPKE